MPKKRKLLVIEVSEDVKVNMPGIYRIRFDTGKFYIGTAKNLRIRVSQHESCMKKGFSYNASLKRMEGYNRTVWIELIAVIIDEQERISTELSLILIEKKKNYRKILNKHMNRANKTPSYTIIRNKEERIRLGLSV